MNDCLLLRLLTPVHDSISQLRRHILWLLLIRVTFFTLLIGVTVLLASMGTPVLLPPPTITVAFLAILFIFSIGSAALLPKTPLSIQRFGLLQLLCDGLFAALLIYGTGCSQSIFTPVLILPVIAGGLIMNRMGGLMAAAAATLFYGGVLALEQVRALPRGLLEVGFIPLDDPLRAANLFAVYGTTFFVTAVVAGTLAARLRKTEEALNRTSYEFDRLSQLYKQIFDDISTGIITVDDEGRVTSCNAAAGKITGFPPAELTGRLLADTLPALDLKAEITVRQVIDLKRKDGRTIRAGYSLSSLNLPPNPGEDNPSCNDCKIITLQDISSIEKMEQRVREAEKMAAIGELSASVAHDFRNPLAAISGSAQLLAMEEGNSPETIRSLSTIILRESQRMARTITDFLQFARPAAVQAEWFDVKRLLREAIEGSSVPSEMLEEDRITITCQDNLDAYGDRQLLHTALIHLLDNAVVFLPEKQGRIEILAREEEHEGHMALLLEVRDNGPGISREIRSRVIRPFFSTRENGTGLGLAIVHQIMEQHGGSLEIGSGPERGCRIRMLLPLPASGS